MKLSSTNLKISKYCNKCATRSVARLHINYLHLKYINVISLYFLYTYLVYLKVCTHTSGSLLISFKKNNIIGLAFLRFSDTELLQSITINLLNEYCIEAK